MLGDGDENIQNNIKRKTETEKDADKNLQRIPAVLPIKASKVSASSHHIFILMGVSGSGKSIVGSQISHQLKTAFLDGDFVHPRANIVKMSEGIPLDDNDRRPWLQSINDAAYAMQRTNDISLIVCSALKKSYRDILRNGSHNLKFLYLKGSCETIEARLKVRKGHFFKPQLLVAQFATLEEPTADESDVLLVDINHPLEQVVAASIAAIKSAIEKP